MDSALSRLVLLAPAQPLLEWAAARLLVENPGPDLSAVTVLLPVAGAIGALRERLAAHAPGGALLGPRLMTLAAFAEAEGQAPATLTALDCKLQLAEALQAHAQLFPHQDAIRLAEDFFALFEELSANVPELAADAERFLQRVARGYGVQLDLFSDEARIVHQLWRAWLQQSAGLSPAAAHVRQLADALERHDAPLYLIGFDHFSRAEAVALRRVLGRENLRLWLQGRREGRDGVATNALCAQLGIEPQFIGAPAGWLDRLLDTGAALTERLKDQAPPAGLRVQAARSPEHEAALADVAIRRWLLAGRRSIAVVSQDRRFARRLRALLERAGVTLRDEAGWALSTSSAAAALMHWLDCVERDFHFRPLLALLRSHFFDPDGAHAAAVDGLERAVYAGGTVSGLRRLATLSESARALLAPLHGAAQSLVLHAGARPARQWSAALLRSLQVLPLWQNFPADAAGRGIKELLEELDTSLAGSALRLDWSGFRPLLERLLEQASFTPETLARAAPGAVRLLTLEQAGALDCEAVLLTGAGAGKFPGNDAPPSLFNQSVRAELGLPHAGEARQLALARWRRLLQAAPEVLITYAADNENEPAQPCAWVELLQSAGVAGDPALADLAGSSAAGVAQREPHELVPPVAPRPHAPSALLPEQLSASAHQLLIDCPYGFHAQALLGLRAPREPDEPYTRSDFGEAVHRVLSRFTEPIAPAQRAEAETRMAAVASEVFAADLRARALTRAWLAEFESLIPDIVDWLIGRRDAWPEARGEVTLHTGLADLQLQGRVDRLERNAAGRVAVVDYKTGKAPQKDKVASGEAVQATHYALLLDGCERVEYLQLRRDKFEKIVVDGEALAAARAGVQARLHTLIDALRKGAALPAHGDAPVCEHCDYSGLCRKGAWRDD